MIRRRECGHCDGPRWGVPDGGFDWLLGLGLFLLGAAGVLTGYLVLGGGL